MAERVEVAPEGPRCPVCEGTGEQNVDVRGVPGTADCGACEGRGVTLWQLADLLAAILRELRGGRRG